MNHEEEREQTAFFAWADDLVRTNLVPELGMLFAVPNGGKRNVREAARLKRAGVKAGVPDVFLDYPSKGFHGLRIEFKRVKGGRATPDQISWLTIFRALGYSAVIANGCAEAQSIVLAYLGREEVPPYRRSGA